MNKNSITRRALRLYHSYNPKYFPIQLLRIFFDNVSPYFTLWMSAEIITALYEGDGQQRIFTLVIIILLGNLSIRIIGSMLAYAAKNQLMFLQDNESIAFHKKTMSLDYDKLENVEIAGILADLPACESNEKELLEICRENSIPDLGISSSPEEYADPWAYIEKVNAFARKAVIAGITFSYHNHGHEFVKVAGNKTAMELFLEGFDKQSVSFMPDTYWVHDGGYDVRYFLEQTGPRIKILHLKDLKRIEQGHIFTEVGNGNLYMEGILKTAQSFGIKYYIVEQDECDGDPFASLTMSYQNLRKILEG